MGAAVVAMAVLLAACGESSPGAPQPTGNFQVAVTGAAFPAHQVLGQTSLMKITVKNSGRKTVPDLTVTVNIEGKRGADARLPFAVREPNLADGDRPVWVLAATYPRRDGSTAPGGAETAGAKTFAFGPLAPGKSVEAVWKLSATRPGKYTVGYEVGAATSGSATAKTSAGVAPGGSFLTEIATRLPATEVNAAGEIVPVKHPK